MNLQDMLVVRKELVQIVASLQPELAKEFASLEKVRVATEAAAKVIGTQAEVDKKLELAKIALAAAQEETARVQAETATETARMSGLREKLAQDSAEVKQRWDDLKEADALFVKMKREHAAKMQKDLQELQVEKTALNTLRDKVAELRESLVAKERELDAKHRAAMKALA